MIRVVLVDDHTIVRHGLKMTLEIDRDISVVRECADGKDAIASALELHPDVMVMDIAMPVMDGVTATHQIVEMCPDVKILILSMHEELNRIKEITKIGASGFLAKSAAPEELIAAVHAVNSGKFYLQPEIASAAYADLLNAPTERKMLTERELDVIRLLAQGTTVNNIADVLCISPRTVQAHLYHAMKKLDVHSQQELIMYAIREGIVDISL